MFLIDFNQVAISNFMQQVGNHTEVLEEGLLRHMILNSIRHHRSKFIDKYGEPIICSDSKKYWRRDVFPYYKANRKKDRQKSSVDWYSLFNILSKVRDELKDNFPYKVLNIEGAEADDIIATLIHEYHAKEENILICSSDKDFLQLQKFKNVDQYSPIHKKFLKTDDPVLYLAEHIVKGDRGDGIPNIRSSDSTFVDDTRQKPLNKRMMNELVHSNENILECPKDQTDEIKRNWDRNKLLIDLNNVPFELKTVIINNYNKYKTNDRSDLLNYFIHNKLNNLTEHIGEF